MSGFHLRLCTILIIAGIQLIQLGESKKIYDCVYDKNKCSVFCGVPLDKMPAGFGCLNSLKACLCPTTPNTKKCRPINPADKDETNGCNSTFNCPSKRLIPMICEFFDQNRMCACFRTEDGKPASETAAQPEPEAPLPAIPNQSGQPQFPNPESASAPTPLGTGRFQPKSEIPVEDPNMNAIPAPENYNQTKLPDDYGSSSGTDGLPQTPY